MQSANYRPGPSFCPAINAFNGTSEILVPFGARKRIEVKQHITPFIVQAMYKCQFYIEGRVTSVSAHIVGDTIYCDLMEFVYTSKSPNLTVPFTITWASKQVDNPDNVHGKLMLCQI